MIIDYKVSNFRSIYQEQSFNMIAVYNEEDTKSHLTNFEDIGVLKSTAIYGPNASGKSNLLETLSILKDVVEDSFSYGINEKLPVKNFIFENKAFKEPTVFDITFVEDNIKYNFGVLLNSERIIEEYLIAYPKKQPQTWYNRVYDEEKEEYFYRFGSNLKGQKKMWEKATKKNVLFLSTAVNLQKEEENQLSPVYNWFANKLTTVSINGFDDRLAKKMCEYEKNKKLLVNFLNLSGIEVEDIEVEIKHRQDLLPDSINKEQLDEESKAGFMEISTVLKKFIPKELEEELLKQVTIKFVYKNGYTLDLVEQSDGTQKLFAFAAHWMSCLSNGNVLFIDELNDNLHPALVRLLVDMFNNDQINTSNAQLIFTTHETSILNQGVLRRDQVWFCDRDDNLSTKIYPLSDFKPRKDYENIENSYMSGKYGALPYFKKIAFKMNVIDTKDQNIVDEN